MATGLHLQGVEYSPISSTLEGSPVGEEPPSPSKEPILLKSFLQKKGKRFRGWHQRYFEIQGKQVYYYKNSTKTDFLGEIDFSKCIHCRLSSEASFGSPFEIRTVLRTHVLSARSTEERDQWIQIINTQMCFYSNEKRIDESKSKRWTTFRNAFKLPRQPHKLQDAKGKKRTLLDRLRLRKSREPVPLRRKESDTEPEGPELHSNRPLSMIEDETPINDYLETLLDIVPSRSLPATPLTKKRSHAHSYDDSPPESPFFKDPEMSFPSVAVHNNTVPVTVDVISHDLPADIISKDVNYPKDSNSNEKLNSEPPINQVQLPEVSELSAFEEQNTWNKVREFLQQESDSKLSLPNDILPPEDQIWMKESCGLEQLRVFLAVCD